MNLEVNGWTERMVVATLADFSVEPTETARKRTDQLYLGYWLQRHGLSGLDKEEVVTACRRLESEGLVQRPEGGDPTDVETVWSLTDEGLDEATRLWNVFSMAL